MREWRKEGKKRGKGIGEGTKRKQGMTKGGGKRETGIYRELVIN